MSKSISVIIPCYNVEDYLPRCLDSVLAQSHNNVQVVMVEDCSTDGTKNIIEDYEEKYQNFHAIYNKKNGGLGNARNVGISASKSDYIVFLDSDDWLPENFLSEMLGTLLDNKADISICDIYLRYDDPRKDQRVLSYNPKPDKFGLINTSMAASSSNKLFKRELFNNNKYPVGIVNEDIPVVLMLMSRNKVAYTNATHFNYYQRTGSIQNSKITIKRFDVFKSVALLRDGLGDKVDKNIWQSIIWHQIIAVFLYVIPKAKGIKYRKDLIEEFHKLLRKYDIDIANNLGLRDFAKISRANKYYSEHAVEYLTKKQFTKLSFLMGVYHFYVYSKFVRIPIFIIRHPKRFINGVVHRVRDKFRKRVIKNNVTINELILEAKRQHKLTSEYYISVVIPNYNYERFLIQRIYSILSQTTKIAEIIILDDVSKDNSVELATKIKSKIDKYVSVKLINNKTNQGTFRQWQRGFNEARGDYVWIAEADDYSNPEFLKYALKPFEENTDIVISYANTGYVNEEGVLLGNVRADIDYQKCGHWDKDYINSGIDEARNYSYLNNTIANVSSVVFKKKSEINYEEIFADALEHRQAGDWVLYVNYMTYGDIAYTNRTLNYYRIHGSNVSSTTKAQDHINEIKTIQKLFIKRLGLNKQHQKKMNARIKFLEKAWGIN